MYSKATKLAKEKVGIDGCCTQCSEAPPPLQGDNTGHLGHGEPEGVAVDRQRPRRVDFKPHEKPSTDSERKHNGPIHNKFNDIAPDDSAPKDINLKITGPKNGGPKGSEPEHIKPGGPKGSELEHIKPGGLKGSKPAHIRPEDKPTYEEEMGGDEQKMLHKRHDGELEWFRQQIDLFIKPPKVIKDVPEKKVIDALKKKAKCRRVRASRYSYEDVHAESLGEVRWEAPRVPACACPFTPCVCSRFVPFKPAKKLPRGGGIEGSRCALKRYFMRRGWCIRKKRQPAGRQGNLLSLLQHRIQVEQKVYLKVQEWNKQQPRELHLMPEAEACLQECIPFYRHNPFQKKPNFNYKALLEKFRQEAEDEVKAQEEADAFAERQRVEEDEKTTDKDKNIDEDKNKDKYKNKDKDKDGDKNEDEAEIHQLFLEMNDLTRDPEPEVKKPSFDPEERIRYSYFYNKCVVGSQTRSADRLRPGAELGLPVKFGRMNPTHPCHAEGALLEMEPVEPPAPDQPGPTRHTSKESNVLAGSFNLVQAVDLLGKRYNELKRDFMRRIFDVQDTHISRSTQCRGKDIDNEYTLQEQNEISNARDAPAALSELKNEKPSEILNAQDQSQINPNNEISNEQNVTIGKLESNNTEANKLLPIKGEQAVQSKPKHEKPNEVSNGPDTSVGQLEPSNKETNEPIQGEQAVQSKPEHEKPNEVLNEPDTPVGQLEPCNKETNEPIQGEQAVQSKPKQKKPNEHLNEPDTPVGQLESKNAKPDQKSNVQNALTDKTKAENEKNIDMVNTQDAPEGQFNSNSKNPSDHICSKSNKPQKNKKTPTMHISATTPTTETPTVEPSTKIPTAEPPPTVTPTILPEATGLVQTHSDKVKKSGNTCPKCLQNKQSDKTQPLLKGYKCKQEIGVQVGTKIKSKKTRRDKKTSKKSKKQKIYETQHDDEEPRKKQLPRRSPFSIGGLFKKCKKKKSSLKKPVDEQTADHADSQKSALNVIFSGLPKTDKKKKESKWKLGFKLKSKKTQLASVANNIEPQDTIQSQHYPESNRNDAISILDGHEPKLKHIKSSEASKLANQLLEIKDSDDGKLRLDDEVPTEVAKFIIEMPDTKPCNSLLTPNNEIPVETSKYTENHNMESNNSVITSNNTIKTQPQLHTSNPIETTCLEVNNNKYISVTKPDTTTVEPSKLQLPASHTDNKKLDYVDSSIPCEDIDSISSLRGICVIDITDKPQQTKIPPIPPQQLTPTTTLPLVTSLSTVPQPLPPPMTRPSKPSLLQSFKNNSKAKVEKIATNGETKKTESICEKKSERQTMSHIKTDFTISMVSFKPTFPHARKDSNSSSSSSSSSSTSPPLPKGKICMKKKVKKPTEKTESICKRYFNCFEKHKLDASLMKPTLGSDYRYSKRSLKAKTSRPSEVETSRLSEVESSSSSSSSSTPPPPPNPKKPKKKEIKKPPVKKESCLEKFRKRFSKPNKPEFGVVLYESDCRISKKSLNSPSPSLQKKVTKIRSQSKQQLTNGPRVTPESQLVLQCDLEAKPFKRPLQIRTGIDNNTKANVKIPKVVKTSNVTSKTTKTLITKTTSKSYNDANILKLQDSPRGSNFEECTTSTATPKLEESKRTERTSQKCSPSKPSGERSLTSCEIIIQSVNYEMERTRRRRHQTDIPNKPLSPQHGHHYHHRFDSRGKDIKMLIEYRPAERWKQDESQPRSKRATAVDRPAEQSKRDESQPRREKATALDCPAEQSMRDESQPRRERATTLDCPAEQSKRDESPPRRERATAVDRLAEQSKRDESQPWRERARAVDRPAEISKRDNSQPRRERITTVDRQAEISKRDQSQPRSERATAVDRPVERSKRDESQPRSERVTAVDRPAERSKRDESQPRREKATAVESKRRLSLSGTAGRHIFVAVHRARGPGTADSRK